MTASREGKEPGLGWFVTGPLLAVAGTVLGTALASQRWADCAHGMDAPTRTGFVMIMPFAWIGMTLLLGLSRPSWWRRYRIRPNPRSNGWPCSWRPVC